MNTHSAASPTAEEKAAWLIAAAALFGVLKLHLLPALLGGLLIHELIQSLSKPLKIGRMSSQRAKLLTTGLLAIITIGGLILTIYGGVVFFRTESDNIPALLQKIADIIEGARSMLPSWAAQALPHDAGSIRDTLAQWLRSHAKEIQSAGGEAGKAVIHTIIGMFIGALIALQEARTSSIGGPLAVALAERSRRLAEAFRQFVFAQVRISFVNTVFTAIYLLVILPLCGIHLPLTKALIVVTFLAGLLPVVGNLISNTAIVLVSLGVSLPAALGSLTFLVVIHKLEYFLNARIVGAHISAHAWELLIAMLVMEALFGLAGVAIAPICYAYLKTELTDRGLV